MTLSMDKYRNKYRIAPARAQWWDYGRDASYFITICTRRRRHFFGRIVDDAMVLSDIGKIADDCWREITDHAKNVDLGPHVVMPNHVHGILNLVNNSTPSKSAPPEQADHESRTRTGESPKTIGQMRFRNPGKNTISTIIGGYKSAVSNKARKKEPGFGWQSRFHDHIIRDTGEYQRIANYIRKNPSRWNKDKFHSDPHDAEG